MNIRDERETLIAHMEAAIEDCLRYFEGPGASSRGRVGVWGPLETLAHMVYWNDVSADAMERVAKGEPPPHREPTVDESNAEIVPQWTQKGFQQLIAEARQVQKRFSAAVRTIPDMETVVLIRPDGHLTVRQRVTRLPNHWLEHVEMLKQSS